jgi:predicted dehydrogenase
MTHAQLGVGVVGLGFVGRAHVDALRRIPGLRVVAVAGSDASSVQAGASALDIPKAYGDYRDLIADPDVDVVHNCTPNYLHTVINRACVESGKACFAEKPLTTTSAEANQLVVLARQRQVAVAVNFNHRGFPQVQRARQLVADGQVGDIFAVHGSYLQDWLLFDTDWNWRLDPALGGASRAVADIGSHWMDLVQHVTGTRISEVMADLSTPVRERYQPTGKIETFGNASNHDGHRVKVDTEDFASVLLRFENGARGSFNVSQISAGRKNRLTFEIDAAQAAVAWDSEDGERLWVGSRTEPARFGLRDPILQSRGSMPLPAGHAEGWNDALRTTISAFYDYVRGGQQQPWVAGWEDGLHEALLTESILSSGREGSWVRVPRAEPA